LVRLIEREINTKRVEGAFNPDRAQIAVLAALLHDIGHGPFSHAFENARKAIAKARGTDGKLRKHEHWSAEIIENREGEIIKILDRDKKRSQAIGDLLVAENPTDMYHAIVSSSF